MFAKLTSNGPVTGKTRRADRPFQSARNSGHPLRIAHYTLNLSRASKIASIRLLIAFKANWQHLSAAVFTRSIQDGFQYNTIQYKYKFNAIQVQCKTVFNTRRFNTKLRTSWKLRRRYTFLSHGNSGKVVAESFLIDYPALRYRSYLERKAATVNSSCVIVNMNGWIGTYIYIRARTCGSESIAKRHGQRVQQKREAVKPNYYRIFFYPSISCSCAVNAALNIKFCSEGMLLLGRCYILG